MAEILTHRYLLKVYGSRYVLIVRRQLTSWSASQTTATRQRMSWTVLSSLGCSGRM